MASVETDLWIAMVKSQISHYAIREHFSQLCEVSHKADLTRLDRNSLEKRYPSN
jgi:hypothetical protein